MRRPATLAACLFLAACDTAGPTAPDSWAVATKHGTVYVDPAADPVAVAHHLEAGFARARTRTQHPERVDDVTAEGLIVVVNPRLTGRASGAYRVSIIEIAPGVERVMDHEVQHLIADRLGIRGPCLEWQDHGEHQLGGCDLDGRWAR